MASKVSVIKVYSLHQKLNCVICTFIDDIFVYIQSCVEICDTEYNDKNTGHLTRCQPNCTSIKIDQKFDLNHSDLRGPFGVAIGRVPQHLREKM